MTCICSQCESLITVIDKAVQNKNEIRRIAAREELEIYMSHYGETADEAFMQKVASKFSY